MAIYHCSIKIISRGRGKSAVAAAAYRAGVAIRNDYDGLIHDYSHKHGVLHTEILLPENAPAKYTDRATLWNAVEKIEKAKNAQLAREVELALPVELTREQNVSLVREYVQQNFVDVGMCADICLHDTGHGNPHAHILLTMRPFAPNGEWGAKQKKEYLLDEDGGKIYDPKRCQYKCKSIPTTNWNEHTKAEEWRETWANLTNQALKKNGFMERVDHRSYQRQGIQQFPTIHMGTSASQMEKRGIRTERGDINREIIVTNKELRQIKARLVKLQKWLKKEAANIETPKLADVITAVLKQQKQSGQPSRYAAIRDLKAASKLLNFLKENNIKNIAGLDEKLNSMLDRRLSISDELKSIERRLMVLDKHIEQAEYYLSFKPLAQERKQMKPRQQTSFTEAHQHEFILLDAAKQYLTGVMNGRKHLPLKAWKAERDKLMSRRGQLSRDYTSLKQATAEVEQIRRSVQGIAHGETRMVQRAKEQER